MSKCPGLHCDGCTSKGGIGLLAAAVAAVAAIGAVLEVIWWLAALAAVTLAAFTALLLGARRLGTRDAGLVAVRMAAAREQLAAASRAQVTQERQPPAVHYHQDVYVQVMPGAGAASVIRAIPARGTAVTEEE